MPVEIPRQFNMFSGELDDNRTRRQKSLDQERQQSRQLEMFSQRDIAQFGVTAHPYIPLSPNVKLLLICEEVRTPEQIEADIQREAERRTRRMFGAPAETPITEAQTLALVPRGVVALVVVQDLCRALIPLDLA